MYCIVQILLHSVFAPNFQSRRYSYNWTKITNLKKCDDEHRTFQIVLFPPILGEEKPHMVPKKW